MNEPFRDTAALPLAGIKVVEFSHMIMGPSCGMILADLGADVVKVEPYPNGDNTRRLNGSGAGFFPTFNRNKRSLVVDLKSSDGHAAAQKLIDSSDVLIENFRPGALDKLGFGYDASNARNSELIYCSLKGFLSGPYEHRAALDEVVQMMGGLAYMTGPTGRPLRAGASVNDVMGGMFAAIAILAALQERSKTGKGQLVRSALFENNVFLVAQHMMQMAVTRKAAAPLPERISAWAVYDLFNTGDGKQIFVGVVSDTQWAAFCKSFGLEEFLVDPDLQTNAERVTNREKFMPAIRAIFDSMTLPDALARCEEIGLPFAPIAKPQDLFDDPHVTQPGGTVDIVLPNGTPTKVPTLPIDFNGQRLGLRHDIPRCGEHSAEVLSELGYSAAHIEKMVAAGVIADETALGKQQARKLA
ncbi:MULTISPECIES: CaiB/BaiF CoA transferase family protein [Agrobacterium]|uniref:Crotonobetainyl-CoA:carnitine CoA-transferase CaiB-like acyl-CoA transferase n=1 Tax=Agrobacterium tumefaciens TaxID=358 RepID=A0AAW8M319_AGRTU|nr:MULTISPECIES: CaiB/BaiF CoA-transferase family protein [Agrobacterium]MBP2511706.1 crotonobetainyl-CoA:carnitine CoA-transferase CaiB-like acyl-CoA transferase [Agrobacterium tumefaciens]MBP2520868.1 crotonobetainyl-CoA:carnitine CoA-transferase CaiB-like acyl-CoA transferase [Agrobacterium tumefaciens]MBP2537561.1 crotonobetainyl-CoA:carnitine CoA-transferase CaiB-like acyl-CoA transferase [Agrobacterium tumefaciens]MBP2542762.1 crotonobetainyl-CoA:carnitine CoA-transferase CaiB-like acyl-C